MYRKLVIPVLIIAFLWIILTLWVEMKGAYYFRESGPPGAVHHALIIYDSDPFYNLDQQICNAYAQTLVSNGWRVTVSTVSAAADAKHNSFDLYVFCANTYNWSPDWAVTDFIKEDLNLKDKNTIAITLGAGSTTRARHKLERILVAKGAQLVDSRSWWLWRPNEVHEKNLSNVEAAVAQAKKAAGGIAVP